MEVSQDVDQLLQRAACRVLYSSGKDCRSLSGLSFDRDHPQARRIFVEVRPRQTNMHPSELRYLLRQKRVSLEKEHRPGRMVRARLSSVDHGAESHAALYRQDRRF